MGVHTTIRPTAPKCSDACENRDTFVPESVKRDYSVLRLEVIKERLSKIYCKEQGQWIGRGSFYLRARHQTF